MKPLYIFDLDGTLALIEHRRHYVQLKDDARIAIQGGPPATCRGPNSKIPGDYWVEFDNTPGWWSHDPSDIKFKPDWDSFHAACVDDKPNHPVIIILHALARVADIWIFSGRSDEVREQTNVWVDKHIGGELYTMMRRAGDFTPDDVLKKSWYDSMLDDDKHRLVAVFDDRDRVVAMWRRNGVTCLQVAPGAF